MLADTGRNKLKVLRLEVRYIPRKERYYGSESYRLVARPQDPVSLLHGSLCGVFENFNIANDGVMRWKREENRVIASLRSRRGNLLQIASVFCNTSQ